MEKYRTFVVCLAGIASLTWCATHGVTGENLGAVEWGVIGLAATAAGRSIGNRAAGGGGLKGMGAALLTPAKPDGEAPAPAPASPAGSAS